MPFGIGAPELIIILVIVVIIFGAGKLPEIGGALGKGIREFKENTNDGDDKLDTGSHDQTVVGGPTMATSRRDESVREPVRTSSTKQVRADEI